MKDFPQFRFLVSPGNWKLPYCALGNYLRCAACCDYEAKEQAPKKKTTRK